MKKLAIELLKLFKVQLRRLNTRLPDWKLLSVWIILSVILGIGTGLLIAPFEWILLQIEHKQFATIPTMLIAVGGMCLAYTLKYLLRKWGNAGSTVEAIHKHKGNLPPISIPLQWFGTILTIGAGGSVGKESPSAIIGSTIGSFIGKFFKLGLESREILMVAGFGAGFSVIFGTPIAGAILAIELTSSKVDGKIFIPAIVASLTAFAVVQFVKAPLIQLGSQSVIPLNPSELLRLALFIPCIGLFANLTLATLFWGKNMVQKRFRRGLFFAFVAGCIIGAVKLSPFHSVTGMGELELLKAIQGKPIEPWFPALKLMITSVTLVLGGIGGTLFPILVLGATFGSLYASATSGSLALYAALGSVSLLGTTANAPLAAIIFALELFGGGLSGGVALITLLALLMVRGHFLYYEQRLSVYKLIKLKN